MLKTTILSAPRRHYVDLDYARHMPKAYVDRISRKVPKKVYDNRFGAPPVIRWALPPDDHKAFRKELADGTEVLKPSRPWEFEVFQQTLLREAEHKSKLFQLKFFRKELKQIKAIPAEEWIIFQGDQVEVMVGPDRGIKGIVSHVIREQNAVFVEGLHQKLVYMTSKKLAKKLELPNSLQRFEQPLFVHRNEVKLVDPNDNEPCDAKWMLNAEKTEYIRVSTRTGYQIPLPQASQRTYEYTTPEKYIEVEGKDTPADVVLQLTYEPKLCTFEQQIEEEMKLERRQQQPTNGQPAERRKGLGPGGEQKEEQQQNKRPSTYWY